MTEPPGSITRLIQQANEGQPGAEDRLFARVYDSLCAMAARRLAHESPARRREGPEDLANESYLRLGIRDFEDRRHLFLTYAKVMRQILIDRARRDGALKHGGGHTIVSLHSDMPDRSAPCALDALDADTLIERLRSHSPRAAEIATLKVFGGLSEHDIAEILDVSPRTVREEWRRARERMAAWVSGDGQ